DTTKQWQLAAVENAITTGADVNAMDSEGSTALHYVASEGSLEIAELLIFKGANVDSMDNYHRSPLHSAIAGGQIKMATLLITNGANINANAKGYILTLGGTALDYASNGIEKIKEEGGSEDLIQTLNEFSKLLRKNGGKTSQELETAESIFAAVLHGNMEAIERYLNDGVDINAADANGLTPLGWAAVNDTPFEIAKFLIDKGANVNARDLIENTPLHDAAGAGHREIVALLNSKGADLNARNKDGETPIDLAAEWQQETVDLLRKLGGRTGQEIDENMPYNSFEKGQLIIYSNIGLKYDVLYSADLRKWQLLDAVTIDAYPKIHVDKTAAEQSVRFYKLRLK
ncbi:MAG: ankyrin repeat domain-containing protein, partial [Verrucomicrobiia bacterium]